MKKYYQYIHHVSDSCHRGCRWQVAATIGLNTSQFREQYNSLSNRTLSCCARRYSSLFMGGKPWPDQWDRPSLEQTQLLIKLKYWREWTREWDNPIQVPAEKCTTGAVTLKTAKGGLLHLLYHLSFERHQTYKFMSGTEELYRKCWRCWTRAQQFLVLTPLVHRKSCTLVQLHYLTHLIPYSENKIFSKR